MKQLLKTLLIIAAAFALCMATNAQTVPPAPPSPMADEIQRLRLVNALERAQAEVRISRKFVDSLKDQVASKEKIIKAQKEKDVLSSAAIESLQAEIVNLRSAISEAEKILETRRVEVAELKGYLEKTRAKLNRARSMTKYLAIAAAVLAAIVVVK